MTVFVDGRPKNAHYRTFAIRGLDGQDDVGAMRGGGVAPIRAGAGAGELDESFSRMPNLVVVDGGKGQLAAALERDGGARSAARRRHLPREAGGGGLRAGRSAAPIVLDRSSPGLQLLQRIRDEAHRVALRYHRASGERARWRRSSRTCPASAPCGGARSSATSARSSASSTRRRRSSRASPACRQKTARDLYAQLHKAGPSVALGRLLGKLECPLVPHGAQGQRDGREPGDDVRDGQRELGAHAEREQHCRRSDAAEDVQQEGLLRPDPGRRDGQQCGDARRDLYQPYVLQRLRDVEGGEQEPDRQESQRPVAACQIATRRR